MASPSHARDVIADYERLTIDDVEQDGLILEDVPLPQNNGYERCLVGSFLSNRKVNFGAMKETLSSIWRPVKGVFMEETSFPNLFIFKFFHELDIKRVLDDGPWTFNQQVLLLKRLNIDEQLKDIVLTEVYIWLQIYDLPIGFNSERVLKSIGNYVGKFLEVDEKNFQGLGRNYLRVKVAINVRCPLKSKMKIKKAGGEWLWINFKYERLPSFCFYCGLIGHSDKFCEVLFDNPQAGDERKYDSSLRAPIRKQNTSRGNQWLRDAYGNLGTFTSGGYGGIPAEEDGPERNRGENSDQISIRNNLAPNQEETNNPNKSGIGRDKVDHVNQVRDVVVTGNSNDNVTRSTKFKEIISVSNYEREEGNSEVENVGLVILDPKRRRMEEQKLDGPPKVQSPGDEDMVDLQTSTNSSQKNLIMAGSAMQTRPSL